jgi:hypothetical protein
LHPRTVILFIFRTARVLGKDLSELSKAGDLESILDHLKNELTRSQKKGESAERYALHPLETMMLSGTLADFSPEALRDLMRSDAWNDERWSEAMALLERYKKKAMVIS